MLAVRVRDSLHLNELNTTPAAVLYIPYTLYTNAITKKKTLLHSFNELFGLEQPSTTRTE